MRAISFFLFFHLLFISFAQADPLNGSLVFDRVEGSTIYFKSTLVKNAPDISLKSGLFDLKYLHVIRDSNGENPYFLFLAKPCDSCSDEPQIYAIDPSGTKKRAFSQPGYIIDPKTGKKLLVSKAFYGKCLPSKYPGKEVLVFFQNDQVDRRRDLQRSVVIARPGAAYLETDIIERGRLPQIKQAEDSVKKKVCYQIEERHRKMNQDPLKLRPMSQGDAVKSPAS